MNYNRMTISKILKELKDDKLIEFSSENRKKYILTQTAIKVVKQIKKIKG